MGFFDYLFGSNMSQKANTNIYHDYDGEASVGKSFDEEYSSDITTDLNDTSSDDSYSEYGVHLEDTTNTFRLQYDGILAKSGAQDIYSVVGYGNNHEWDNIEFYKMHKADNQTFETLLPINKSGNINIAFKDGADHWDNNSGTNYCFHDFFNEG
jgi:hypothetical protein